MSTDHAMATATSACERYALGEMSPAEEQAFEAHYFTCSECAERVGAGEAFARAARVVFSRETVSRPAGRETASPFKLQALERRRRFQFAGMAIAAGLACMVVGYQNLVTIPGLKAPHAA